MIETMEWWNACEGVRTIGKPPTVERLTHDSRQVAPGTAFVAVPGARNDGHNFIGAALAAGAAALVVQADHEARWARFINKVPMVVVADTRAAMGPLAAAVYGKPSRSLLTIGVTGTDGKTTTAHLIAHILSALGLPCGYLTSVGFETGSGLRLNSTHMTTLEVPVIQEALAEAVRAGLRAVVVEASSEGLAQHRLDGCEFDVAVFTNLSRDHLDFHGSMEAYRDAKGRLFEMLDESESKPGLPDKAAIVNADDAASPHLSARTRARRVSYGFGEKAFIRAQDPEVVGAGIRFVARVQERNLLATVRAPLLGEFNVYNCLASLAVAFSQGLSLSAAGEALATFPGVPGRMERVECGQPYTVVVDIASTPAALEGVLKALRPATKGNLWVVFGAAGGRDPGRRDGMGRVAGRLADRCVLTNEDPRDEDPEAIIEAIAQGLREEGRREGLDFVREPDRRTAIRYAFEHAGPGETVLLAGKATEPSMVFGSEAVPWDERAVARELLSA